LAKDSSNAFIAASLAELTTRRDRAKEMRGVFRIIRKPFILAHLPQQYSRGLWFGSTMVFAVQI